MASDIILRILKESPLFGQFEDSLLTQLIELSRVQGYAPGEVIIPEGVTNDTVYVLLDGRVVIHHQGEVIVTYDRPGDLIGEMSVISKRPTSAQVSAEDEVSLFTIKDPDIRATGSIALMRLLDKVFLDILNYKLHKTTDKAKDFEINKRELHHTKEALGVSEGILNSIFASMTDGVVVTDSAGALLQINAAFSQMVGEMGIPEDLDLWPERLGLFKDESLKPLSAEELPMRLSLAADQSREMEIFLKNESLPEGRWLLANASPLCNENQEVKGMVVVLRDETKRKQQQAALILAKEEAEKTAKAKTNFLAVMSHELKTPLNSVIGMADLLCQSSLAEEPQDLVKTLKANGEALLTMVQNILELNQMEAGQELEFKPKPIELEGFFAEIAEQLGPLALSKKLDFALLKEGIQARSFPFDPVYLRHVLVNLIHNAIKFTNQGGVKISAKLEESGALCVTIADTGVGIAKDMQERIFTPFGQTDTSFARKQDGIGIGLALSQRIAKSRGGEIKVQSVQGKGSLFTLLLPPAALPQGQEEAQADQASTGAPKPIPAELPLSEEFAELYPYRVLVAEDNLANQKLIQKVLLKLGYESDLAKNGLEAVQMAEAQDYDLILMDLQMPELDGVEAARRIMTHPHQPVIVALTANTTAGIQAECEQAGMKDYMSKPLRIQELAKVLAKWHQD